MATFTDGINCASLVDCAGTATSFSTAPTLGGVVYASSGTALACTAAGTTGQVLTSVGAGPPVWGTGTAGKTILNFNSVANVAHNGYLGQSYTSASLGGNMFIIPRAGTISAIYMDMRNSTGSSIVPGGATSRTCTLWWGHRRCSANRDCLFGHPVISAVSKFCSLGAGCVRRRRYRDPTYRRRIANRSYLPGVDYH